MNNSNKTRLLVINFGGIGDEILFLPTLASIRKRYPDWHITLLLEPRSRSVAQITDLIDDVLEFDIKRKPLLISDLFELLGLLRNGNFDVALSSGSSPLVSTLLFLSGISKRIGYDSSLISSFLLTNPVPLNYNQYAANMYHDLAKGLDIHEAPALPSIKVPAQSIKNITEALEKIGLNNKFPDKKPFNILIHPGISKLAIQKGIIKTWSVDSWAKLISLLVKENNVQVILAGGPDDKEIVKEIKKKCEKHGDMPFYSVAGLTKNLADLAALIGHCDLLVCVDSAPMHVAVALDKPLVALFGPTDENKLLPSAPKFKALHGLQSQYGVNVPVEPVFEAIKRCYV